MDELLHVVYLSRAAAGTDPENGCRTGAQCRARNDAAQIRGVLAYCRGWFLQWLEGPAAAVVETMGRIAVDKAPPRRAGDLRGEWTPAAEQSVEPDPGGTGGRCRTLDNQVRALMTALPGRQRRLRDFVPPSPCRMVVRGSTISRASVLVVTGASIVWALAVVSQAAHVSRVELARTRLQSPDLRDTDGLVEYLTTTDSLTVIAIASSTMPAYLESLYHRA